jgi:hypothetical protein
MRRGNVTGTDLIGHLHEQPVSLTPSLRFPAHAVPAVRLLATPHQKRHTQLLGKLSNRPGVRLRLLTPPAMVHMSYD